MSSSSLDASFVVVTGEEDHALPAQQDSGSDTSSDEQQELKVPIKSVKAQAQV